MGKKIESIVKLCEVCSLYSNKKVQKPKCNKNADQHFLQKIYWLFKTQQPDNLKQN